jgi:photosystem II stability/assembly factor-like uncharacterized protein
MSPEPVLYVGTVGEGLWRSVDGGQSWERLRKGLLSECEVRSLAIDPRDDRRIHVGTNEGVFISTDGGQSFASCGGELAERVIWSLAISHDQSATLLAGARPAAVYRSDDRGASWRRLPVPVDEAAANPALRYNRVTWVGFDPGRANQLWVGVEIGGIFTSEDGGQSFEARSQGLSSLDIHGLAIVSTAEGARTLVASTDNDVHLSFDDGRSWQPQQATRSFPYGYCRGLCQHPARPAVLYLGNGDGPPGSVGAALRSVDGGRTWQRLALPGVVNSTIWGFATHPADPQRVYAYSVSGQVFLSRDGGDGWEKLPREFGEIRALAWSPDSSP